MDKKIYSKFKDAIKIFSDFEKEAILKAFKIALKYHKGQIYGGRDISFINHPLEVAINVLNYGKKDWQLVVAALLHDTLEDTELNENKVKKIFGKEVLMIIKGDTRSKPKNETEKTIYLNKKRNWRILMNSDEKVRFIKCCDWLANCRNWLYIPKGHKLLEKLPRWKKELKKMYLPLAFKTNPEIYKEMKKVLEKID